MVIDSSEHVVSLNSYQIEDWADGADVINVEWVDSASQYLAGADGKGIQIMNPSKAIKLTLKVKQTGADAKWLNDQYNLQRNNIRGFTPLVLSAKDLLNQDTAWGKKGYFVDGSPWTRGNGHNATTFAIVFHSGGMTLTEGFDPA